MKMKKNVNSIRRREQETLGTAIREKQRMKEEEVEEREREREERLVLFVLRLLYHSCPSLSLLPSAPADVHVQEKERKKERMWWEIITDNSTKMCEWMKVNEDLGGDPYSSRNLPRPVFSWWLPLGSNVSMTWYTKSNGFSSVRPVPTMTLFSSIKQILSSLS